MLEGSCCLQHQRSETFNVGKGFRRGTTTDTDLQDSSHWRVSASVFNITDLKVSMFSKDCLKDSELQTLMLEGLGLRLQHHRLETLNVWKDSIGGLYQRQRPWTSSCWKALVVRLQHSYITNTSMLERILSNVFKRVSTITMLRGSSRPSPWFKDIRNR